MSKIMLINVTHLEESRVGIVRDGVLESFEIESLAREHLKGNIYKGTVHRIHAPLEAAFVDIGADRDAFLPLDEICFRNLPNNGHTPSEGRPKIKDVLKPGQEILVQVVKDQFAGKPPTLSTFYSLPGRYLVLLPGSDEAGISRKIEGEERARFRALIAELKPPEGFGIIVRTAAGFDQSQRELERDLVYLQRLWESIVRSAQGKHGPGLVYREHDLVMRNIRDYFTPDIDEIHVDNEEVYQRARDFLHNVMPGKEQVLHLYEGTQPIFSHFNVEAEIESIYKRRVPLKSGGSIVIDGTEALTAIDVNSGGSTRGGNQEETAFKTNMEAAPEIARQLRLRDLGGLIVIDFIDMRQPAHNHEVEKVIREAMKPDKARHDIGRISRFGLIEVSRQRLRPAAAATSYTACPMCEGYGLVRTTESAALVALRKIHNRVAQGDVASLRVTLRPDVAVYLLNQKREDLALLERNSGARIQIGMNEKLMPHQSEIEVRARVDTEPESAKAPPRPGEVVVHEPAVPKQPAAAAANDQRVNGEQVAASAEGKSKKRRRRGRRRGRGRAKLAAAAVVEALTALGAHAGLQADTADTEPSEPQEREPESTRTESPEPRASMPLAARLSEAPASQISSSSSGTTRAEPAESQEGMASATGRPQPRPLLALASEGTASEAANQGAEPTARPRSRAKGGRGRAAAATREAKKKAARTPPASKSAGAPSSPASAKPARKRQTPSAAKSRAGRTNATGSKASGRRQPPKTQATKQETE